MGIKERKKRERLQRKDQILNAAEAIFKKRGYEVSTMEEVAAAAELSKGTLYLYYKSKEELYLGIGIKGLRIMHQSFREAFSKGKTGWEKIRMIGQAYISFATEYPDYYDSQLHFETRVYEIAGDYKLTREHIEITTQINSLVFDAVTKGVADGSLRSDLDPEMTGMLLWAFSSGFVQFVVRREEEFSRYFQDGREVVFKAFFDLLLQGLKG